jgi:hypothetical protein
LAKTTPVPLIYALAFLLLAATATASQTPHPAIVRVVVPQKDATSYGSGTLVDAGADYGLVITNWHVVRDASGPIHVQFPGGFRTGATVLKIDADWDLAALGIWKPPVSPLPITTAPPQPGEPLAIAGYGSGSYRLATGRCTKYYSPGKNLPYEIVEVSTPARNGDSGGPILNQRGEIAGVLFGEGQGHTAGSYGGRVERFLADVRPLVGGAMNIARAPERDSDSPAGWQQASAVPIAQTRPLPTPPPPTTVLPGPVTPPSVASAPVTQPYVAASDRTTLPPREPRLVAPRQPLGPSTGTPEKVVTPAAKDDDLIAALVGTTPWEKLKSAMAGIGALALFLLTTRAVRK